MHSTTAPAVMRSPACVIVTPSPLARSGSIAAMPATAIPVTKLPSIRAMRATGTPTRESAAERPEEIGDGGALGAQGFDAGDAAGERAALGVDDVELACDAVLVAQAREAERVGERGGALRFSVEALARAGLAGERRANFAERGLDGLLVLRHGLLLARLGEGDARLQLAAGEE